MKENYRNWCHIPDTESLALGGSIGNLDNGTLESNANWAKSGKKYR